MPQLECHDHGMRVLAGSTRNERADVRQNSDISAFAALAVDAAVPSIRNRPEEGRIELQRHGHRTGRENEIRSIATIGCTGSTSSIVI